MEQVVEMRTEIGDLTTQQQSAEASRASSEAEVETLKKQVCGVVSAGSGRCVGWRRYQSCSWRLRVGGPDRPCPGVTATASAVPFALAAVGATTVGWCCYCCLMLLLLLVGTAGFCLPPPGARPCRSHLAPSPALTRILQTAERKREAEREARRKAGLERELAAAKASQEAAQQAVAEGQAAVQALQETQSEQEAHLRARQERIARLEADAAAADIKAGKLQRLVEELGLANQNAEEDNARLTGELSTRQEELKGLRAEAAKLKKLNEGINLKLRQAEQGLLEMQVRWRHTDCSSSSSVCLAQVLA